ncbi:MAG: hypothetical protein O2923_03560 [Verrucomicrobia bacterium]|nr:hypothetical protein [Verrucomicrobiota bacterium]MDA1086742.1 hypothetical protein [Verrucomicrobiota bacterium]
MKTPRRALSKRILAHVPNVGVLIVIAVLPLMWPRQQLSTAPVQMFNQRRILFVGEATTQFDPTAIAVPDEDPQFTDDPEGDVVVLGHRLSNQLQPATLSALVSPPARSRAAMAKPPVASRARRDLGGFTLSAAQPKVFPTLTPAPEPVFYAFHGALDSAGFTRPEWPADVIAKFPAPWAIRAELTVTAAGQVEHVFLETATEDNSLNARLTAILHEMRFTPSKSETRGTLSISFERLPGRDH